jgi:hypothetical protein
MSGSGGDPLRRQLVGRQQARLDELSHPEQAHRAVPGPELTGREPLAHLALVNVTRRGLGEADGRRARELEGRSQHRADLLGRRWREDRHARDGEGERHVEDAVVAGPVIAGDPGPVQHEDHRAAVEPHIEVGLIEGTAEEGGVDGDDGPEARHGHAGGRRDLVLLGDPHVEEAGGKAGLEGQQSRRPGHRRRQGDHTRVVLGGCQQGAGEGIGVGGGAQRRTVWLGIRRRARAGHTTHVGPPGATHGDPGRAPDGVLQRAHLGGLHVVEALDVVLLGRPVAAALLGEDVDDDRPVPLGGMGEGLLHHVDVVTVDRSGVANPERFEEGVRRDHLA